LQQSNGSWEKNSTRFIRAIRPGLKVTFSKGSGWTSGTIRYYLPFYYKVQTVDSSFKTGVKNDYSVIATWATDNVDYYLLDIWREKVEFDQLITGIKDQYGKWHPNTVLIEDAASGQSAIQTLRNKTRIPVEAYNTNEKGSKLARAEGVTPIFRVGKVWLPPADDDHAWIEEWVKEHCGFPRPPMMTRWIPPAWPSTI
jgi:predicted phage terminase large subunit-like protein